MFFHGFYVMQKCLLHLIFSSVLFLNFISVVTTIYCTFLLDLSLKFFIDLAQIQYGMTSSHYYFLCFGTLDYWLLPQCTSKSLNSKRQLWAWEVCVWDFSLHGGILVYVSLSWFHFNFFPGSMRFQNLEARAGHKFKENKLYSILWPVIPSTIHNYYLCRYPRVLFL